MAQTPKSASVQYNSTTPTTIYTVPAATTAVVRTLMAQSQVGTFDNVTINKISNSVNYPIIVDQPTAYIGGNTTYYLENTTKGVNLLTGPITLAAGDSLSISTTTTAGYKFPQATLPTSTGFRISNLNYLNGNYIAVGRDVSLGLGLILTSSNGTTWTRQTFPYSLALTDVGFDGTYYVVVGTSNNGFVYYSTNLTSWTQQAAPNATDMHCITYGNGKWVAGGASGVIWYATTPTAWSTSTLSTGGTLNTILTIGTNWAICGTGPYAYTSNLTTFTVPYWFGNVNRYVLASDAAGALYICNGNQPNAQPTICLYKSTDLGKTTTAVDLTSVASRPTTSLIPFSFNNGARILWPITQSSTNNTNTIYSANGTTWSQGTIPQSQPTTGYPTNLRPLTSSYAYGLAVLYANNWFYTHTIAATGLLTGNLSFSISGSYMGLPNDYGVFAPIGNPATGTWIAAGYDTDTTYQAFLYGTSISSGGDSNTSRYAWSSSQGSARCGVGLSTGGYLIGTSTGRMLVNASLTAAFAEYARPFTVQVQGMAANGTTLGSKIIAVDSDGYSSFSVDNGVTWTNKIKIANGFPTTNYSNSCCLTYGNGYWIAYTNSGNFIYTTDGITWVTVPYNVDFASTLNSLNIFINGSGGLFYSTGTNIDAFTSTASTLNFTNYPSVRRMTYVSGTYFIGYSNTIYSSTDLNVWSSNNTNSLQINNTIYTNPVPSSSGATAAFAYSGSGTSLIMGSAVRTPGADNANISIPTVSSLSLVSGSVTAGIVEIT